MSLDKELIGKNGLKYLMRCFIHMLVRAYCRCI